MPTPMLGTRRCTFTREEVKRLVRVKNTAFCVFPGKERRERTVRQIEPKQEERHMCLTVTQYRTGSCMTISSVRREQFRGNKARYFLLLPENHSRIYCYRLARILQHFPFSRTDPRHSLARVCLRRLARLLFALHAHNLRRECAPRELRFGLLKQRLLELVRRGETEEALSFAAERLAPEGAGDPALLRQVEEAVTLLAFEVRLHMYKARFHVYRCGVYMLMFFFTRCHSQVSYVSSRKAYDGTPERICGTAVLCVAVLLSSEAHARHTVTEVQRNVA